MMNAAMYRELRAEAVDWSPPRGLRTLAEVPAPEPHRDWPRKKRLDLESCPEGGADEALLPTALYFHDAP